MHSTLRWTLVFLLTAACAKASELNEIDPVGPQKNATNSAPSADSGVYKAAMWASVKNSKPWTDVVLQVVRQTRPKLERARDISDFCPSYNSADTHQQEDCWVRLISAVAFFESGFNPADTFEEPSGTMSVGLLALSPSECSDAPGIGDLKNPVKNLLCGVHKMAYLINRDGFVDGPAGSRGAAAYWSTLREHYSVGHYHVGTKDKIVSATRCYKDF
jgi:hypothetical protein